MAKGKHSPGNGRRMAEEKDFSAAESIYSAAEKSFFTALFPVSATVCLNMSAEDAETMAEATRRQTETAEFMAKTVGYRAEATHHGAEAPGFGTPCHHPGAVPAGIALTATMPACRSAACSSRSGR